MRRRTARNRSTTPPPDTGFPGRAQLRPVRHRRHYRAVSEVVYSTSQTARRRIRHAAARDPCNPAHAGNRLPAVALGADRGPVPTTRRAAPAVQQRKGGVGVGDHLFDTAVYTIRCPARSPRPAATISVGDARLPALSNDAADRLTGRPHRLYSSWEERPRFSGPVPRPQRTRRRMNLLPNRVPMVFSSVAAVASL